MDKEAVLRGLVDRARGVIFDFDGILADSERYHYLAYRQIFARYGHRVDEKEYYRYFTSLGLGARGEIERHRLDLDPVEIAKQKGPIFSRYCRDGSIKVYPAAKEIVRLISALGKRLIVASGSLRQDILAVLEREGMQNFFQGIVGKNETARHKPHPDAFLTAAERLGLSPGECLVLEDAEKGLQAALAAGIPVIIAKSRETRPFEFPGADLVLDNLDELASLLNAVAGR